MTLNRSTDSPADTHARLQVDPRLGRLLMPTATVGRMEAADWRNLEDSKGQ